MAEAALSEETQGKKSSFVKILLVGLNAILFLSGIGFFLMTKFGMLSSPPAVAPPIAAEAPKQMAAPPDPGAATPAPAMSPVHDAMSMQPVAVTGEGVLVDLRPFVVNLQADRRSRYLRIAIQLELAGKEWEEDFNKRLPQIRNRLIFLLSNQTVDDILSVEGKYQLQNEIVQHVNEALGKAIVQKAYFTDFIVQ